MMRNKVRRTICANLARIRNIRRHPQRVIAETLSISQSFYSDLEAGKSPITAVQLAVLAEFFCVPIQAFYERLSTLDEEPLFINEKCKWLGEQLEHYKYMNDLQLTRIAELEGKVRRKDEKINLLLQKEYNQL
ncbi:helix-turn-helix domain-containing protein [Parapedobacter sp. 10938]|uniref:helix-turn-helix domain-containing protein n=1 Tax=Parapedobacter flavus TaxID=3110225 RepID=UPI002DB80235|nr:helix-turn-helix transcriptional regulator [Parapedobacter sp. 10938]MEC3881999.1 helix-turn-helix transcriptional regulator [Parapedobacter sp. 10938]